MSTCRRLFLLDTNVVSNIRRPRPDPSLLLWLDGAPPGSLAISWSTVFEIQLGVELSRRKDSSHADVIEGWLEDAVLGGRFRVLRPSTEAARLRARMHATPALANFLDPGRGIRRPALGEDLTIAATAIANDATIVTYNTRDFVAIDRHFPLAGVLDPGTREWAVPPPPDASSPWIPQERRITDGRSVPVRREEPYRRWGNPIVASRDIQRLRDPNSLAA